MKIKPRYPIYIISKGRWESRLTARALEKLDVPYRIVIEPQEYKQYAAVIHPDKILVLPFSNLGQGSIPARNWVWEHSISEGHVRHWILDDNISHFFRLHQNRRVYMGDGTAFCVIEDFADRYENVAEAGMHYKMFAPNRQKRPPILWNHRVYSNILILNEAPFRWRGRYNEDTDLSLRMLKAGWCTVLFFAFLADKKATMTMKGGNTDKLYKDDGRYQMALSLQKQHPDVTTITRKWGRWQHQVNYKPFEKNRPILKPGVNLDDLENKYKLVQVARKK